MNSLDFAFIAALLKERSGLIVTPDKEYLLDARLSPVARKRGLAGLAAVIAALRAGEPNALADEVVDAMTTNETSFFRDRSPFDALRRALIPALIARRTPQRTLRIWSAACSTGQEPYSVAMIIKDDFPALAAWKIEIIATDISPSVLERARAGTYSTFEVQRGMPVHLLVRHFEQIGETWRIKPELRGMVSFRPANLLNDISMFGTFDIILCRNVLIYFDQSTKTRILHALTNRMAADGALLLGGAESIFGLCDALGNHPVLRGVYTRAGSTAGPAQPRALTGQIPDRSQAPNGAPAAGPLRAVS